MLLKTLQKLGKENAVTTLFYVSGIACLLAFLFTKEQKRKCNLSCKHRTIINKILTM